MSSQFIPSGRTSLVKKGEAEFQLQTEYGSVPSPRITTTIFTSGKVLHKIEQLVEKPVDSIERMHDVEDIIKTQHLEVSKILREEGIPTQPESRFEHTGKITRSAKIRAISGVEKVYLVTSEGKITGEKDLTKEFKKIFKHIFRELPEMMNVFAELPGQGHIREEGIYEIEQGRILLVSTGVEFFLILLKSGANYNAIASQISSIVKE